MARPTGGWQYPREDYPANGLVPSGGATGQVLKKISGTSYDYGWGADNDSGGGGGSLPAWAQYHPDTPPAVPTLFGGVNYNLEFMNGETALGTAFGSPQVAASIVDRSLRIPANLTSASVYNGQEFPCPPGGTYAFTMTVRFRRKFQLPAYSVAHIGLRANASGAGQMANMLQVHRNTGTWDETDGSVERWANETTNVSFTNDNTPLPTMPWWYYRFQWTGTNLLYSWSTNGFEDDYQLFVNDTQATAFGAGNNPGRCFFGARSINTTFRPYVYIDWVRFTP